MNLKSFVLLVVAIILILGIGTGILIGKKIFRPQKTHFHSGFVVFENGKKLDFSATKYMFLEPCKLREKEDSDSAADVQIEKAHLHDNVGDVVHSERTNPTWQDLFTNIHFPIDYSKTTGFINGHKVENFQTYAIHPYDSLVVFIGKVDTKLLSQAVTKKHIQDVEKTSPGCGE